MGGEEVTVQPMNARLSETIKGTRASLLGPKTLTYSRKLLGRTMDVDQELLRRLRQRLQLSEVGAQDNHDVIFAFVPIVSRAGTDIESALQQIPRTHKKVVLMALHFTFDANYVAPQSTWNVHRDDVFAVDFLCYEDLGLLRSLRNDESLKAVTDHLISIGASPRTQLHETAGPQRPYNLFMILILVIIIILVAIIIACIIYARELKNHIAPTLAPNTTTSMNTNSTSN